MKKTNIIIVFNKENTKLLMCYRKKPPYQGLYNFVGGKVKENESSIDAAYRELYEETNISYHDIYLSHFGDFVYHLDGFQLEIYVGKLFKDVNIFGLENELEWIDLDSNFFDITKFAGDGNIGHMLNIILNNHSDLISETMLIKPTKEYIDEIKNYREEFILSGDSFDGCADLRKFENIEEWLNYIDDLEDEHRKPAHYVTSSQYILVRKSNKRILGMIQLRHELNDYLLEIGGNIGYSVRVDERRKGYAFQMLSLMLDICKDRKMDRVLLTCNEDNVASRKTILKNHGIYENKSYEVDEDNYVERYWIHLK